MFTNLSTSIKDTSFVDFINLLVSKDTIIILNLPPFPSVYCVKNLHEKPLKIKFSCWKT